MQHDTVMVSRVFAGFCDGYSCNLSVLGLVSEIHTSQPQGGKTILQHILL